jgi:hypothetical protein
MISPRGWSNSKRVRVDKSKVSEDNYKDARLYEDTSKRPFPGKAIEPDLFKIFGTVQLSKEVIYD